MRILILGLLFFHSVSNVIHAQESKMNEHDYHLIYIELSNNNNRMGLINELNGLFNSFTANGDSFISYLSNAENGKFFIGSNRIEELFYLIGDLNISLPNVEFDLRKIINYWNENDITYLDDDGITHHLYRSLKIHYFVSPSFYNLSGEYFASKLLSINNLNELNGNTSQVQQVFYFNADDTDNGFLSYVERKYKEGLETSVNRKFITY